jgi:hypothetical protein
MAFSRAVSAPWIRIMPMASRATARTPGNHNFNPESEYSKPARRPRISQASAANSRASIPANPAAMIAQANQPSSAGHALSAPMPNSTPNTPAIKAVGMSRAARKADDAADLS